MSFREQGALPRSFLLRENQEGKSKGNVNVMECIDCICPLFFRVRVPQTVLYLKHVSGAYTGMVEFQNA